MSRLPFAVPRTPINRTKAHIISAHGNKRQLQRNRRACPRCNLDARQESKVTSVWVRSCSPARCAAILAYAMDVSANCGSLSGNLGVRATSDTEILCPKKMTPPSRGHHKEAREGGNSGKAMQDVASSCDETFLEKSRILEEGQTHVKWPLLLSPLIARSRPKFLSSLQLWRKNPNCCRNGTYKTKRTSFAQAEQRILSDTTSDVEDTFHF